MKILIIHQNFPGQFREIAPRLISKGHEIKAICSHNKEIDPRIDVRRYKYEQSNIKGGHPLTKEIDEWIWRSELVAKEAKILKENGWAPDVILAHPGWGETLLIKQIYESSALVIWPELWLQAEQMGEKEDSIRLEQKHYLKTKNNLVEIAMVDAQAAILPTRFQAKGFPMRFRNKIKILHEGVKDELLEMRRIKNLTLNKEFTLKSEVPVVTFISRNLEPMRGFPEFMRSLPYLLKENKEVNVVIVGGDGVSYSSTSSCGKTWKEVILNEVKDRIDFKRVHFIERLQYPELIKIYLRSDLHVYLSNSFVLSWSLTEIMACGTPVLAANNEMLREVVVPGFNGALYSGTEEGLGVAISELLKDKQALATWGENARDYIKEKLCLNRTIDELEAFIEPMKSIY